MTEPRIILRFHAHMEVLLSYSGTETRVGDVSGEGFRFLTAWEAGEGFELPTLWPANLQALAKSLPAIVSVIERAETDLLAIQLALDKGQQVSQDDIDALNADS